jgi:hypothetical protein
VDTLLATILRSLLTKAGWAKYGEYVNEEVITNTDVLAVRNAIGKLHQSSERDIRPSDLVVHLESIRAPSSQKDLVQIIEDTPEVNESALQEAIKNYGKSAYLERTARYIAINLGPDIDLDYVLGLVHKAVDVSESVSSTVVDLAKAGLPGDVDDRSSITPLGLSPKLDACIGGGVAAGELAVILAPPARGKTSYLCAIGANAAKAGRTVLHVTLEISGRRVVRRYDTALTHLTRPEQMGMPLVVARARDSLPGGVKIKDWSYADVTPNDIKALVKSIRQDGGDVDLVIIDYLELMSPNKTHGRQEQRHRYGQLGKELRAVAVGLEVPILTAWQVNREGSGQHAVTLKHVSESWDIIKHADFIFALNQNDKEQQSKLLRISVLKQRESTERLTEWLSSDLDRMIIAPAGDLEGASDDEDLGPSTATQ